MKRLLPLLLFVPLLFSLAACNSRPSRLTQGQVIDLAWKALEPYTSSQRRENWDILQAEKVTGLQVVDQFGDVVHRKCPGPALAENQAIHASGEYWYIKVAPKHLIEDKPKPNSNSKVGSAPEGLIPEPILQEATFLIDPFSGQVVAQTFNCGD